MAVKKRRAVGVGDCCWCEVRGDVVVAAVVVAVVHGPGGWRVEEVWWDEVGMGWSRLGFGFGCGGWGLQSLLRLDGVVEGRISFSRADFAFSLVIL